MSFKFLNHLETFANQRTTTPTTPDTPYYRKQLILHLYYTEYQTMDLSQFDPSSFLDSTINNALIARPPLPAGREFQAEIGEVKSEKWTSNKDPSAPKSGIKLNVPLTFLVAQLPPDVQKLYAGPDGNVTVEKIVLTDGVMLDLVEINGQPIIDLAPGRNAKLRRYREATNNNVEGQPFNPRMLQGHRVLVKIKHRVWENNTYDEPDSVAKI